MAMSSKARDLASVFTFLCLFSGLIGGAGGMGLSSLCWSAGLSLWDTYKICGIASGLWGLANYLFVSRMD
jgi:hypothetical protein